MHYLTRDNQYMPVPIADGASHWGRQLLEMCLIPLIFALLIRGQRKLNANAEKMRVNFGFHTEFDVLIKRYAAKVRALPWPGRVKEWIYLPIDHLSNDRDKLPLLADTSP